MMPSNPLSQSQNFSLHHRLDEYSKILPGFRDAGRRITFNDAGNMVGTPTREILLVTLPAEDPALNKVLTELREQTAGLPLIQHKTRHIVGYINDLLNAGGVADLNAAAESNLTTLSKGESYAGQEVTLGQVIEGGAGLSRHRALLFKVVADALDIPATLVRGNYHDGEKTPHAWNEVSLEGGRRLLVDTTLNRICDLSDPQTLAYKTVLDEPVYVNGFFIHHPLPVLFKKHAQPGSGPHNGPQPTRPSGGFKGGSYSGFKKSG